MSVTRFGVSIEQELLDALDLYVRKNKFTNRSQAIRQLISKNLVEKKWECNQEVAGAIILVYDHHKKDLVMKSMDIQHDFHDVILSVQHFHLSHDNCLEIIAVKGRAVKLTALSEKIIALKGIQYGKLLMGKG
jgi:CopG family transcriptional regulator, nickel-responsive regulator